MDNIKIEYCDRSWDGTVICDPAPILNISDLDVAARTQPHRVAAMLELMG